MSVCQPVRKFWGSLQTSKNGPFWLKLCTLVTWMKTWSFFSLFENLDFWGLGRSRMKPFYWLQRRPIRSYEPIEMPLFYGNFEPILNTYWHVHRSKKLSARRVIFQVRHQSPFSFVYTILVCCQTGIFAVRIFLFRYLKSIKLSKYVIMPTVKVVIWHSYTVCS